MSDNWEDLECIDYFIPILNETSLKQLEERKLIEESDVNLTKELFTDSVKIIEKNEKIIEKNEQNIEKIIEKNEKIIEKIIEKNEKIIKKNIKKNEKKDYDEDNDYEYNDYEYNDYEYKIYNKLK